MRKRRIDNFANWREKMKKLGKIPKEYSPFLPSEDLAEYIGVVLGDGHIEQFPRTERIYISCNSNRPQFVRRYTQLTAILFQKNPTLLKARNVNCIRISLYQKKISERLKIPCGNRKEYKVKVPAWIFQYREYLIRFLRGLFEAEGSLSVHKKTSTYNFSFSNTNQYLLRNVTRGLKELGFHPEVRYNAVRLRKKEEVRQCLELLQFRQY